MSSDVEEPHVRIGRSHELLAAVCFDQCWSRMFPWVSRIRLGTPDEDAQGKDVVVETRDVGDIPIQVKSSRRFLKKHFNRYPDIPVLIVYRTHTEEQVRKALASLIKSERSKRDPSYVPSREGVPPPARQAPSSPLTVSLGDVLRRPR